MGEGVFAHHDGVIHDDTQGHDQGKQADHIDGATGEIEHRQGGQKRDRDPHRNPERHPYIEKQEQGGDHQDQSADAVFQQQVDAITQVLPALVVHLNGHPLRQTRPHILQPLGEYAGGTQGVLRFGAHHQHFNGGLPVDRDVRLVFLRAALHLRQIPYPQQAAAAVGKQGHFFKALHGALLAQAAHLFGDFILGGGAGRQVGAVLAHPVGDFGQRQAGFMEGGRRHLDGNFFCRHAHKIDLTDAAAQQFILELARQHGQLRQGFRPHDDDVGDGGEALDLLDHRPLGFVRQVADGFHPLFHPIQYITYDHPLLQFQHNAAGAGPRSGGHLFYFGEGFQFLLHGDDDGALHILGAGTTPGHGDTDVFQFEVGKELGVHFL